MALISRGNPNPRGVFHADVRTIVCALRLSKPTLRTTVRIDWKALQVEGVEPGTISDETKMKLSIGDIQNLLRQAGWPEDLIVTAAAVFYFESAGGRTDAHKVDSIERSYGLAQVNTNFWRYSPEQLYDPLFNLQVAYQIYQQQGWRAWYNTYYGGRYRQYMDASQAAYDQGSTETDGNGTGPVMPPASDDIGSDSSGNLLLSVAMDL